MLLLLLLLCLLNVRPSVSKAADVLSTLASKTLCCSALGGGGGGGAFISGALRMALQFDAMAEVAIAVVVVVGAAAAAGVSGGGGVVTIIDERDDEAGVVTALRFGVTFGKITCEKISWS